MHLVERLSIALRHHRTLESASWLWNGVRPVYDKTLDIFGRRGLERVVNGTDKILISPSVRELTEEYEPEVWKNLMAEVRPGDVAADVGAYIGVYSVALAKRVGPNGLVVAFEPDQGSGALLREHLRLNGVEDRVEVVAAAAGSQNGLVSFYSNLSESHITPVEGVNLEADDNNRQLTEVRSLTLDSFFANRRLDILKIDVEGYEELVLRGAQELLADTSRGPRVIYIEVHPFAWEALGVTSESLLGYLTQQGYRVLDLQGEEVSVIHCYGEVVAHRIQSHA